MARLHLDLPSKFYFRTELTVRIGDINYGGHLGNDSVLSLIHEARLLYLKSLGFSELDIGGASLIMADSAVVYKGEAFHGDQILVEIAAGEFTSRSFDLYFKLTDKVTNKEIADAKTGMLAFDYKARKVTRLPEQFVAALSPVAAESS